MNAWTDRISSAGFACDLNGNTTAMPQLNSTLDYDWSNRVTAVNNSNGSFQYSYSPDNRRIWFKAGVNDPSDFSLHNGERYVLYSPGGRKMGTYKLDTSGGSTDPLRFFAIEENIYWGAKLVARHNANTAGSLERVYRDRLSSEGNGSSFFPFGDHKGSGSTVGGTGREAFATYTRDSQNGLDYADQRYYAGSLGRFVTPDPAGSGSNWYIYAGGDPVNSYDPSGLYIENPGPSGLDLCWSIFGSNCSLFGGGGGGSGYEGSGATFDGGFSRGNTAVVTSTITSICFPVGAGCDYVDPYANFWNQNSSTSLLLAGDCPSGQQGMVNGTCDMQLTSYALQIFSTSSTATEILTNPAFFPAVAATSVLAPLAVVASVDAAVGATASALGWAIASRGAVAGVVLGKYPEYHSCPN